MHLRKRFKNSADLQAAVRHKPNRIAARPLTGRRHLPSRAARRDQFLRELSCRYRSPEEDPMATTAVRILGARTDIRIVFTYIDMPGSMDGMKLAAAVRGRWPPIEIIVTSGRYDIRQDELPARGVFLRRPYPFRERLKGVGGGRRCSPVWRLPRHAGIRGEICALWIGGRYAGNDPVLDRAHQVRDLG